MSATSRLINPISKGVLNPRVQGGGGQNPVQKEYCSHTVKNGGKSMKIAMKHHQTLLSMTEEKK